MGGGVHDALRVLVIYRSKVFLIFTFIRTADQKSKKKKALP
jgi:hypothetical protein